jgi:hypothetical protein
MSGWDDQINDDFDAAVRRQFRDTIVALMLDGVMTPNDVTRSLGEAVDIVADVLRLDPCREIPTKEQRQADRERLLKAAMLMPIVSHIPSFLAEKQD